MSGGPSFGNKLTAVIQTCATTSVKVAHFADVYNSLPLATPRPRFGLFGFQLRLFFFPFLLPFLGSSGVVFANMNTSALNELCEQESMKHIYTTITFFSLLSLFIVYS